jgi:hypothetical protein
MSEGFGHIYFDKWEIGNICLRNVRGKVLNLGIVVAKELVGRAHDEDIKITFNKDGQTYEHIMEFDRSYKLIDATNTNDTL